ncbi:MAG: sugar phosphate nucleotidyltransferase [Planctomycetota bacterium]
MAIRKVVIPVAGVGTRLLPVTKSQPKEMLPVGRKPVVQYVVEEAIAAGFKEVLFITGRQKTSIEDHFDADVGLVEKLHASGRSYLTEELSFLETDAEFFFVRQSSPEGLADAVRHAKSFVGGEPFLVSLGDSIIKATEPSAVLARMVREHERSGAACTIAVEEVPESEVHRYGIVQPKGEAGETFAIADVKEKPLASETTSRLAIAARYIFDGAIFDAIERTAPDRSAELQLTDSIRILIKDGHRVQGVKLGEGEKRYDVGNFESYFRTFVDFALEDEKYGYTLRQHLSRRKNL